MRGIRNMTRGVCSKDEIAIRSGAQFQESQHAVQPNYASKDVSAKQWLQPRQSYLRLEAV